jgi:hypothetical protein
MNDQLRWPAREAIDLLVASGAQRGLQVADYHRGATASTAWGSGYSVGQRLSNAQETQTAARVAGIVTAAGAGS